MTDAAENPSPAPEELPMEIHKPKPVHSWREFLTEMGTITLAFLSPWPPNRRWNGCIGRVK